MQLGEAPAIATPTVKHSGLLLLALVLAGMAVVALRRYKTPASLVIGLVAVALTTTTLAITLDGLVGDWTGIAPLATDPVGDAPARSDITAAFGKFEAAEGRIYLRADVKTASAPPTVTSNQAAGQADPTNSSPVNFTVTFSEPVTGFTAADVATTGSTATIGTITITGAGPTYNVAINATGSGVVVASIIAGAAQDAAGNNSLASTSTDNTVTPAPIASSSRVFVSSTMYRANFGGHAGADAECQNLATHAALGGTWKAWISDSTSSPAARFTQSTGPYRRLDGALIAANWADLTDGALVNAISIDEYGNGTGKAEVWTATNSDGTYAGGSCSDFTSIDRANTSYPWKGRPLRLASRGRRSTRRNAFGWLVSTVSNRLGPPQHPWRRLTRTVRKRA